MTCSGKQGRSTARTEAALFIVCHTAGPGARQSCPTRAPPRYKRFVFSLEHRPSFPQSFWATVQRDTRSRTVHTISTAPLHRPCHLAASLLYIKSHPTIMVGRAPSSRRFSPPRRISFPLSVPLENIPQPIYALPSTQQIRVTRPGKRGREDENDVVSVVGSVKRVKSLDTSELQSMPYLLLFCDAYNAWDGVPLADDCKSTPRAMKGSGKSSLLKARGMSLMSGGVC